MTVVTYKALWCEAEGCEEEFGPEHDTKTLREYAEACGWVRVGGKDLCEQHAPSNRRPS